MSNEQGGGNAGSNNESRRSRRQRRPATPRVTVVVTKEIIERSEQRKSSHCMIAEAVKAAVPEARSVAVDLQSIRYSDPVKRLRYVWLTPRLAQIALLAFDQGTHSTAFTMVLRGAQVVKMGDKQAPRPTSRTVPAMPEGARSEMRQSSGSRQATFEKIGGQVPPTGPLTNTTYRGMRRAFGLKLLKY